MSTARQLLENVKQGEQVEIAEGLFVHMYDGKYFMTDAANSSEITNPDADLDAEIEQWENELAKHARS